MLKSRQKSHLRQARPLTTHEVHVANHFQLHISVKKEPVKNQIELSGFINEYILFGVIHLVKKAKKYVLDNTGGSKHIVNYLNQTINKPI